MSGPGTILDIGPDHAPSELEILEGLGHRVVTCSGPGDDDRCPLLDGGTCALAEAADGVVFRLDLDRPANRELLRCYRDRFGAQGPLHVVVGEGEASRHHRFLEGLPVSAGSLGQPGRLSSEVAMAAAARSAGPVLAW